MVYVSTLQAVIAGAFAILGALCVLNRRPDLLLSLGLVALGFGNFWVYALGSVWLPVKIVGVWSFVYVALQPRRPLGGAPPQLRTAFVLLGIFVLVGSIAGYVIRAPFAEGDSGGTQGAELRPLVQLIGYATAMSFVPLAFAAVRFPNAIRRIFGYYAAAVVVVSLAGIYQYAALRAGVGFMPIYRWNGVNSEVATFAVGTQTITRLYSLAGEPKALGIFLTPFVVCGSVLSFRPRSVLPAWWNRRTLFLSVALIDVLTYSSAILIVLGVAVLSSIAAASRGAARALAVAVVPIFIITGIWQQLATNAQNTDAASQAGIESIIYNRTAGRVEETYQSRNEVHALQVLYENPVYFATGVGLGMYVYHLPGLYFGTGVEPMDSGWVVTLMDLGIAGTSAMFAFLYLAASNALSMSARGDSADTAHLRVLGVCVIAACAAQLGTSSLTSTMIWCGLAAAAVPPKLQPRYRRERNDRLGPTLDATADSHCPGAPGAAAL